MDRVLAEKAGMMGGMYVGKKRAGGRGRRRGVVRFGLFNGLSWWALVYQSCTEI